METNLFFRRATIEDINELLIIAENAREFIKTQGFNQWQSGYPEKHILINDIENNNLYVATLDERILGFAAAVEGVDLDYVNIYEGTWLSNENYIAIHRVAIDSLSRGQNIASFLFKNIERIAKVRKINSLRIDTHPKNFPMNSFLKKQGFIFCGLVSIVSDIKYNGYEKVLYEKN